MEDRISVLKSMHNIMIHMNNEDAYWRWVTLGVPDEPSEDDFQFIASNKESFDECVEHFARVFKAYIEDGLYTDGVYTD